jgi:hypothetical protein
MNAGECGQERAGPRWSAASVRDARAAATAVLVGVAAVLALHVVRRDLAPASRRLSEYAIGPWDWVMTSAFLAVAAGAWLLRRSLWPARWLSPVRVLLAVAAVGLVVSALVPTDPTRPGAVREAVHSTASGGALLSLVIAATWTVTRGAPSIGWRRGRGAARVAATGAVLGVVLSPVAHDGPWTGVVQRLSYACLLVWMLLVCRAITAGGPDGPRLRRGARGPRGLRRHPAGRDRC